MYMADFHFVRRMGALTGLFRTILLPNHETIGGGGGGDLLYLVFIFYTSAVLYATLRDSFLTDTHLNYTNPAHPLRRARTFSFQMSLHRGIRSRMMWLTFLVPRPNSIKYNGHLQQQSLISELAIYIYITRFKGLFIFNTSKEYLDYWSKSGRKSIKHNSYYWYI